MISNIKKINGNDIIQFFDTKAIYRFVGSDARQLIFMLRKIFVRIISSMTSFDA